MKEFFERMNSMVGIRRNDIIEKDYHLHRLLHLISTDQYLHDNLVFKGGTCLMKGYLNYYRFSEDLDFTWSDPTLWEGKNISKVKRDCSRAIDLLLPHFKTIAKELGFTFKGDKKDPEEVHISSGGGMVNFKMRYFTEILGIENSIKIEIYFIDEIIFPVNERRINSIISGIDSKELEFLFKDNWNEYTTDIDIICYDPREIFIEKCRAAITRRVFKLRDLIDLYFMEKEFKYSIGSFIKEIKKKTNFSLDLYGRYRENIDIGTDLPSNFDEREEMQLLIIPIPDDLEKELRRINRELNALREEIVSKRQ